MIIGLLIGGFSHEREVSLSTGKGIESALLSLGHNVIVIDVKDHSCLQDIIALHGRADVVFNALHGPFGEDGTIQGVLEMVGIPYTHCGVLSSAICMDKLKTYDICKANDIVFPAYACINRHDTTSAQLLGFDYPCVIKPVSEGSSVGVSIVRSEEEFSQKRARWAFGDRIMVQEYIKGREIHVGLLSSRILGSVEIKPFHEFYDYQCKYTSGKTEYIVPAPLTEQEEYQLFRLCQKINHILGCRSLVRCDFILRDGRFYFLEMNTQPGFTPQSLVPKIVDKMLNMSYAQLVQYVIDDTLKYFKAQVT